MKTDCQKYFDQYNQILSELADFRTKFNKINRLPQINFSLISEKITQLVYRKRLISQNYQQLIEDLPVSATGPEGIKISLNLKNEIKKWQAIYDNLNIRDADNNKIKLPENIRLTPESQDKIRETIKKYGFNQLAIIPPGISPQSLISNLQEFDTAFETDINDYIQTSKYYSQPTRKLRIIFYKHHPDTSQPDSDIWAGTRNQTFDDIMLSEYDLRLDGLDLVDFLLISYQYNLDSRKQDDGQMPFSNSANDFVHEYIWLTRTGYQDLDTVLRGHPGDCIYACWIDKEDDDTNTNKHTLSLFMDNSKLNAPHIGSTYVANLKYQLTK